MLGARKKTRVTTEGGLDVLSQMDHLAQATERLKKSGIRVAYFVDPEPKQIESSQMAGAEVVELHTGTYADALSQKQQKYELNRIKECVSHGAKIGLKVHAGHGLNYENTAQIAAIHEILELNIGHAIIAKSLSLGIAKAVADMKKIMLSAR